MLSGHGQRYMGVEFTVNDHVKFAATVVVCHLVSPAVCRFVFYGESKYRMRQSLDRVHGSRVVRVGNDKAVLGYKIGKSVKDRSTSVRSLKKSRWSASTFRITATVGKKFRKELQYSQDSRMIVSPWPTR